MKYMFIWGIFVCGRRPKTLELVELFLFLLDFSFQKLTQPLSLCIFKARLHWRICSAFSSDVFAIDVHVFCHRYKFKQGKFNGKPWGDAV